MRSAALSLTAAILAMLIAITSWVAAAFADETPPASAARAVAYAAPAAPAAGPTAEARAAARIQALAAEAATLYADPALAGDDRQDAFRSLLARELDLPLLARFAAGRTWRRAEPAAREAYVAAFSAYLPARYAALLDDAAGARVAVVGAKTIAGGDVLVETRVALSGGSPTTAFWRLRDGAAGPKIVDLMVEGVSLAQTLRREFATVLAGNGGRVDALTALMREKTS